MFDYYSMERFPMIGPRLILHSLFFHFYTINKTFSILSQYIFFSFFLLFAKLYLLSIPFQAKYNVSRARLVLPWGFQATRSLGIAVFVCMPLLLVSQTHKWTNGDTIH